MASKNLKLLCHNKILNQPNLIHLQYANTDFYVSQSCGTHQRNSAMLLIEIQTQVMHNSKLNLKLRMKVKLPDYVQYSQKTTRG